eukprot:TRINITY_DN51742_c0_g1_i1.p1 TRINITY_DN51742_c0_g1~~TRINITY_DN51742_c0_g1_i1.p1  ORF type:complete len:613 (-),score=111.50 TRINITY_DN51742_c0_g1_i1:7-1764(-)
MPGGLVFSLTTLFASAAADWPGPVSENCKRFSESEAGYTLRRLATLRVSKFAVERDRVADALLQPAVDSDGQPIDVTVAAEDCDALKRVLRLLRASALPGHDDSARELLKLVKDVFEDARSGQLEQMLRSDLALFGMLVLAGRSLGDSLAEDDDAAGHDGLAASFALWQQTGGQPHWSTYQAELWLAIRTRRPPSLASAALALGRIYDASSSSTQSGLQRAAALLASAQGLRLTTRELEDTVDQVGDLVARAAEDLAAWAGSLPGESGLRELAAGLADWPVLQLLADLEVSDVAEVRASGKPEPNGPSLRFQPMESTRMAVIPFRELISDHNRVVRKFHCNIDFLMAVEAWATKHLPEKDRRLVAVEVGCALGDCLIWAAVRLGGRLRAVCFEADELAVAAVRRSIAMHGLEGQVEVLHRRITNEPLERKWRCKPPEELGDKDKPRPVSWELCGFFPAPNESEGLSADSAPSSIRQVTIDAETKRLGFGHIDIFKSNPPLGLDALWSAHETLLRCTVALVAAEPDMDEQGRFGGQINFLRTSADFPYVEGFLSIFGWSIIARRYSILDDKGEADYKFMYDAWWNL